MSRVHHVFGRRVTGDLTPTQIAAIIADGRARVAGLAEVPVAHVLLVLERLGRAFAAGTELHRELLDRLPGEIGFSREMVQLELAGLAMALSRPFLEGKLTAELGRLDAVDGWHRRKGCPLFQRAVPRGLLLHVASGNVSTTGVLSVVEGILTRNVNVLKAASAATTLPARFAEALAEADPNGPIAGSLAVLIWSGEREPLHEPFLAEADAIVVWGGEEVVAAYRQGLGPQGRLIAYGPKVSASFYGAEALTEAAVAHAARAAARDVGLWDQNACSSAQTIYLEDPVGDAAPRFVQALAGALDELAVALPMGTLDLHERAEITKERELALADQLLGQATLVVPSDPKLRQAWTIVAEADTAFKLSPLFRTVTVKSVPRLEDAVAALAPWRAYFQTAGLAVAPARAGELADALVAAGAHRVTRTSEMSGGAPGEPHDGVYGLGELVRWASLDVPGAPEIFDGETFVSRARADARSLAKRRLLVESRLPLAAYYRERLAGVRVRDEADWLALPLLTRDALKAQTPPTSTGLITCPPAPPEGGHWLRSGGTSGDPKLSIFGFEDYEEDMARAARGAWAAGLRPGDKVANLFFAGDLYGSFLSLNRVLELVGANSFPFTNNAPVESVITCLREFGIGTVMGLSTWVQGVLAEAARDPRGIAVHTIFYTGEPFHDKERVWLRERLGVERVASIGYGAVDAGPMGYACTYCQGGVHHVHDDHVYLEVLDPDTGAPCTGGEVGELVVTSLNRRVMPLLRYRIGDLGRWIAGACPCGVTSPRFELLGRIEDRVALGRWRIDYGDVVAVVAGFPELAASPQLVLTEPPGLGVRVEAAAGDPVGLARELREHLVVALPGLDGLPLSVEVLAPGGLERVGRTGKVVRIVDRRGAPP